MIGGRRIPFAIDVSGAPRISSIERVTIRQGLERLGVDRVRLALFDRIEAHASIGDIAALFAGPSLDADLRASVSPLACGCAA
jgi:hypothetical protein